MRRRRLPVLVLAALLPGCGKRIVYDTPSQKPERQFSAGPSAVSAAIVSTLANNGFSVRESSDTTVIARKVEPRLHGIFTSPPPGSSTDVQYAFTLIGNSGGTRVIANASIVYTNERGEEHAVPGAPNEIMEEMRVFLNSIAV